MIINKNYHEIYKTCNQATCVCCFTKIFQSYDMIWTLVRGGLNSLCNGIRGCASDLSMVFIIFGIALCYRLAAFHIVSGCKNANYSIDLGQKMRKSR